MSDARYPLAVAVALAIAAPLTAAPAAGDYDLGGPQPDPARAWTVLAFLDADNDLEAALLLDLNEMEAGLPEAGVDVIALVDRAKDYTDIDGDWHDARVYRVRPGERAITIESQLLAELGEVNCGDPKTLERFLAAALKAFPARRYALVLSDHGSGWAGNALDEDAPGAEGGTDELTTAELTAGVRDGLKAAGVERLDLIVFDMCLMGQIELAAAVRPFATFMVASEALVPASGFPYDEVLPAFTAEAATTDVAKRFVYAFAMDQDLHGRPAATASAVDLDRLPAVIDALDATVAALGADIDALWPTLSRALFYAESYAGRADYRQGEHACASVDLLDALDRVRAEAGDGFPAAEPLTRLHRAMHAAVPHAYAGPDRRLSRGLAIYAPVRADILNRDYGQTAFATGSSWLPFLRDLHKTQQRQMTPPRVHSALVRGPDGKPTQGLTTFGGNTLEFTVEGENILWTLASQVAPIGPDLYAVMYRTFVFDPRYDQRKADAAAELADLVMPVYADGPNVLRREIGGLGFRVTDGTRLIPATVDLADPADVTHARVPAIYEHDDTGKLLVDILFDTNTGEADAVIGFIERKGGGYITRDIEPKPDAKVTLAYNTVTAAGDLGIAPTERVAWGKGLELVPVFQDPGQYVMVIEAESIAGKSAALTLPYAELPKPAFDRMVRDGRGYTAGDLIGTWQMLRGALTPGAADLTWADTGVGLELAAIEKQPGRLRYAMKRPGAEGLPAGVAIVDTRGAPMLIFCDADEDGRLTRTDAYVALRTGEGGRPAFVLKDITLGAVIKLTPATPLPDLAGTWVNADEGLRVVLTADTYDFAAGGERVDRGTYQHTADQIVTTSADGEREALAYTLKGRTLTIVDEDGTRFVLTRAP